MAEDIHIISACVHCSCYNFMVIHDSFHVHVLILPKMSCTPNIWKFGSFMNIYVVILIRVLAFPSHGLVLSKE
jgi:hypothetical protein